MPEIGRPEKGCRVSLFGSLACSHLDQDFENKIDPAMGFLSTILNVLGLTLLAHA
jgi:hypothetical protein